MATKQPTTVECDPLGTGSHRGTVVGTERRRATCWPYLVVEIGESRYRVAAEDVR
jgi:hypothetical protein